jgi:GNAT superfamily N-acetyltransferase
MGSDIRQALLSDAPSIRQLLIGVWPEDEEPTLENITRALANIEHASFVTVQADNDSIVGFVDSFLTEASDGTRRWEIDLLAVHPDWRGRGLASQLVNISIAAGLDRSARLTRALVRADNVACQRVMRSCGLLAKPCKYQISTRAKRDMPTVPPAMCLVPVQTCLYRGYWLEYSSEVVPRPNYLLHQSDDEQVIGTLLQVDEEQALQSSSCLQWWEFSPVPPGTS